MPRCICIIHVYEKKRNTANTKNISLDWFPAREARPDGGIGPYGEADGGQRGRKTPCTNRAVNRARLAAPSHAPGVLRNPKERLFNSDQRGAARWGIGPYIRSRQKERHLIRPWEPLFEVYWILSGITSSGPPGHLPLEVLTGAFSSKAAPHRGRLWGAHLTEAVPYLGAALL